MGWEWGFLRRFLRGGGSRNFLLAASFGGGPSSDLFGFLLYLDETDWGAGGAPNVRLGFFKSFFWENDS